MQSAQALLALQDAYRILFCTAGAASVSANQLKALDRAALKQRYHQRAFDTHPDRAEITGRDSAELEDNFRRLTWAYRQLMAYLEKQRCKSRPVAKKTAATAPSAAQPSDSRETDHYWCGSLPSRKLQLGQYLYYSGRISWKMLQAALDWQRQQRPRFGDVAVSGRLMTPRQLHALLSAKRRDERIGDAAKRLGLLSQRHREVVLSMQRHRQPLIGRFFVEQQHFSEEEIERVCQGQQQHNRTFS